MNYCAVKIIFYVNIALYMGFYLDVPAFSYTLEIVMCYVREKK